MTIEKVSVSDFNRISKENEQYVWHFITKDDRSHEIFSYFREPKYGGVHFLKEIIDEFKIPYFESYVEDSVDFILNSGVLAQNKIYYNGIYSPVFMGFRKKTKITSTMDNICYCSDGIIEIICKTLIELPFSVKEKYLK